MEIIGLIVAIIFWLVWLGLRSNSDTDPQARIFAQKNATAYDLNAIPSLSELGTEGEYTVMTYRQSGNYHQNHRIYANKDGAIAAALSTFRRAKVEYIVIVDNSSDLMTLRRWFYDYRGRAEGKKLGYIEIHRKNIIRQPSKVSAPIASLHTPQTSPQLATDQSNSVNPVLARPLKDLEIVNELVEFEEITLEFKKYANKDFIMILVASKVNLNKAPVVMIAYPEKAKNLHADLLKITARVATSTSHELFQGSFAITSEENKIDQGASIALCLNPKSKRTKGFTVTCTEDHVKSIQSAIHKCLTS